MNPEVWKVMQGINREAAFLNEHAFGPASAQPLRVAVQNERIHYALWENDGKLYLFGVNTADRPVRLDLDVAQVAGRAVTGGRRLFDEDPLDLKNGVLQDEFPPCGRWVYEFELDGRSRQETP